MTQRTKRRLRGAVVAGLALVAAATLVWAAHGAGEQNPITGHLELVYEVQTANGIEIYHKEQRRSEFTETQVTQNTEDDSEPRIAISPITGDTWVIYERGDGQGVYVSKRTIQGGFAAEDPLSLPGAVAANPEITDLGAVAVAVYEAKVGAATQIIAGMIPDEPDPFGFFPIGLSEFQGNVDAAIDSAGSEVWASWIGVGQTVYWRQRTGSGGWTPVQGNSYAGSSVEEVRDAIRDYIVDGVPFD